MKKIVYFFLLFLLISCKEEELQPHVYLESPYELKDDPTNPVNHKRYLIYKEYGVPVFFSDTLSNVYITKDAKGDSIFARELLDLNWNFSTVTTIDYKFNYITKEEEQLKALTNIEKYLASSVKSLMPFSIFLVDDLTAVGNNSIINFEDLQAPSPRNIVKSLNTYRTLVISKSQKSFSENFWPNLSLALLKDQVKKRILGEAFKAKLLNFQTVTDPTHYGNFWENMGGVIPEGFTPVTFRPFNPTTIYPAEQEAIFAGLRTVFGQFGFIGLSSNPPISPNTEADRNLYIDALLSYNEETFERLWSSSPLVMEKYGILKDIIVNDMEIPLHDIIK